MSQSGGAVVVCGGLTVFVGVLVGAGHPGPLMAAEETSDALYRVRSILGGL